MATALGGVSAVPGGAPGGAGGILLMPPTEAEQVMSIQSSSCLLNLHSINAERAITNEALVAQCSGGFFSGERFKKHEIDHRFGGHFRTFYCVGGHLNGHFLGFFKCSPLKNPPPNG